MSKDNKKKNIKKNNTPKNSNLFDTHFSDRVENLRGKRENFNNKKTIYQDYLLQLFAKQEHLDTQELKNMINPYHETYNSQLQQKYEIFCKEKINTMLNEDSDKLIDKGELLKSQEKAEKMLTTRENINREQLEQHMDMDSDFLEMLAEHPIKSYKLFGTVKIAIKDILAKKILAIAEQQNLRENDMIAHHLRTNYATKKGEKYILDPEKFQNTSESVDFSIFKDLRRYKAFQNISISGKELITELESRGESFIKEIPKNNNKSTKNNNNNHNRTDNNIYNHQSLSHKRLISDFLSWRWYNQPKTNNETKKSLEQRHEELETVIKKFLSEHEEIKNREDFQKFLEKISNSPKYEEQKQHESSYLDTLFSEEKNINSLDMLVTFTNNLDKILAEERDKNENENKNETNEENIDYGDTTSEQYRQDVVSNGMLDDEERLISADKKLQYIAKVNGLDYNELDEKKKQAILEAHTIGRYEAGTDGKIPATIFHYTPDQIKRKLKILKDAGFATWERKSLLLFGFCGEVEKKVAKEISKNLLDELYEQINKNTNDFFNDEEREEFEKKIQDQYNFFDKYNDAKEVFKNTFQKKYDDLIDTPESEEKIGEKKERLENIIDILDKENKKHNKDKKNRKDKEDNKEDNKDGNNNDGNNDTLNEEDEKTPEQEFLSSWAELEGDSNAKFETGTLLYLDVGKIQETNFPPFDSKESWLRCEIISVPSKPGSGTFDIKVYNATSDIAGFDEGVKYTLPATKEMLEKRTTEFGSKKVKKVKNIKNTGDFNDSLQKLLNAGILGDYSTIFGENNVYEEGGKLWKTDKDNKKVEVKYFSRTGDDEDNIKVAWKTHYYTIEKISNGQVTFNSKREGMDPNEPGSNKKFSIHRTLSYADFILLMEDKQLQGYDTLPDDNTEIDFDKKHGRDAKKGDFNRFSIDNIFDTFKGGLKKINAGLDAYNESQKDKFDNLLFSREGLDLFSKGASFFGALGFTDGLADAFDNAAADFYAGREERTRKLINNWYEKYDKDPHFATLWHEKLVKIMTADPKLIEGEDRFKFAAGLLFLMKKDGPWSRDFDKWMGKGEWAVRILGPKHKKRFKKMQELKIRELDNHEKLRHVHWRQPRSTILARFEFDYIIGVIDGRQPFGGGDWDEHYQASRWGRKFVSQLEEHTNKYFGGVVEKANELKSMKDFPKSEQEYYRHIKNMRPHKSIPYLINMARTAQSDSEMNRVKKALMGALLSGMLWTHADSDTRTLLWKTSRSMAFVPGTWVRDQDQKNKIWTLLNHMTGGSIAKDLKVSVGGKDNKKVEDFGIKKFGPDKNEFLKNFIIDDFPTYWNTHGDRILEYLEMNSERSRTDEFSLITLANDDKNPNNWLGKKYITPEFDLENDDEDTRFIYQYAQNSPWTASKSLTQYFMPQRGKFVKRVDEVEIEGAKAFWSSVSGKLPTQVSRQDFKFFLSRFHSWFSEGVFNQGNLSNLLKTVPLVQDLKKQGRDNEGKYVLWHAVYGSIIQSVDGAPTEFSAAINRFVDMIWGGIEYLDTNMAEDVFGSYTNTIERDIVTKPYKPIKPENWKRYYKYDHASSSSRIRTEFIEDFPQEDYVWEHIKSTRRYLRNNNLMGEEPTPPWKIAA